MKQPNVIGICPVETSYMVKDHAYMIFNVEDGAGNFLSRPTHVGYTIIEARGSAHLNGEAWDIITVIQYWRKKLGITNV